MGEEEEEELKGHTIKVDLHVTLKDLYVGQEFKVRVWGCGGLMQIKSAFIHHSSLI